MQLCGLVGVSDTIWVVRIDAVVARERMKLDAVMMVCGQVMRKRGGMGVEVNIPVALAGLFGSCFL